MNILNQPGPGNGNRGHSVFSSAASPQHRRHILPVAFTLPPAPNSSTLRCSVQPSGRSSWSRPAPLVDGDSNGAGSSSSAHRDEVPLPISRRPADHDAAVDNAPQGRRRHVNRRSAVVLGTSVRGICSHVVPDGLQIDGGDKELDMTDHELAAPRYYHLSTGEEEVKKRKQASSSSDAADDDDDDVELGPRTSGGTLDIVRSLMDDGRCFRLTEEYYYPTPRRSHLDRRQGQQHQQLLFPDREEELPPPPPLPLVLTLAVSVLSAVRLESKQLDQIARKMRKLTGFENLRVENTVDPSLIAGFVISYGEDDAHVIDLSVKGRLAELEARLQSSDQIAGGADGGWSFPERH